MSGFFVCILRLRNAFGVLAGIGVDAYGVASIDKERYIHFRARGERGELRTARNGITFHCWRSIRND